MKHTDKTYKFRIYPDQKAKEYLNLCFGHTRFIYNYFLHLKSESYEKDKISLSYNQLSKLMTSLKKEKTFLNDVPSIPLQQKLRDLDTAFKNFFSKKSKYPKFKHKLSKQSCRFQVSGLTRIDNRKLCISKGKAHLYKIPINFHRDCDFSMMKSFTISKNGQNQYFVSCVIKEIMQPMKRNTNIIGCDLGLKDLFITSQGNKINNPKYFKKSEKKIRSLNQSLSRKNKNSNNWKKAKKQLNLCHSKIANQRKDYLHKLSFNLVNENQVIIFEDLQVKNMVKNKKLAKSISDTSWSMLTNFIAYKSNWYGRSFIQVDKFFPSTKLCNVCHHKNDNLTLNDRNWICPSCQTKHDRDKNSAINIKVEGMRMIANDKRYQKDINPAVLRVCGEVVRSHGNMIQTSMKQEAHSKSIDLV